MRVQLSIGRGVAGLAVVVIGVLLLLRGLKVLGDVLDPVWPLLFAVAGFAFLALSVSSHADIWTSIPGLGLLGLAGSGGLESVAPGMGAAWGGSLFLGGIGLGFLAWHAARRQD